MSTSIVTTKISKDDASVLAASDDRELLSQGLDDFLPYDLEFDALVEIQEVRARKNFDNQGVFVKLTVRESSAPREVQPNKTYALAFFDKSKVVPEFVITKMLQSRRAFAAAIAGVANSDDFKAAPVLLQLHQEVEPLGIKMRLRNQYVKTTRTGKKIHELAFELVPE